MASKVPAVTPLVKLMPFHPRRLLCLHPLPTKARLSQGRRHGHAKSALTSLPEYQDPLRPGSPVSTPEVGPPFVARVIKPG